MPYEVATTAIQNAMEALFDADTGLTALLASKPAPKGGGPAIYDDGDVAQGQLFPYLTIGAWTQVPDHSLGASWGWNCTVQLKVVAQRQALLQPVLSALMGLVEDGTKFDLTGYGSAQFAEMNVQPVLRETLAGVPTYSLPAILRVYVHDAD